MEIERWGTIATVFFPIDLGFWPRATYEWQDAKDAEAKMVAK